jgi:hypothetical protein
MYRYYNTSPTLSVEQLLSQSSISRNLSNRDPFVRSNDPLENLILDEAYAAKCINDIPTDTESTIYETKKRK